MHSTSRSFTLEILSGELSASGESYPGDFTLLPCSVQGSGHLLLQKSLSYSASLHRAAEFRRDSQDFPGRPLPQPNSQLWPSPSQLCLSSLPSHQRRIRPRFTLLKAESPLRRPPHIDLVDPPSAVLRSSQRGGESRCPCLTPRLSLRSRTCGDFFTAGNEADAAGGRGLWSRPPARSSTLSFSARLRDTSPPSDPGFCPTP